MLPLLNTNLIRLWPQCAVLRPGCTWTKNSRVFSSTLDGKYCLHMLNYFRTEVLSSCPILRYGNCLLILVQSMIWKTQEMSTFAMDVVNLSRLLVQKSAVFSQTLDMYYEIWILVQSIIWKTQEISTFAMDVVNLSRLLVQKSAVFRRNMDFSMIGLENFRHQIGFCKVLVEHSLIFFSKLRFCHLQVICNEIDESISSTKQTKKNIDWKPVFTIWFNCNKLSWSIWLKITCTNKSKIDGQNSEQLISCRSD